MKIVIIKFLKFNKLDVSQLLGCCNRCLIVEIADDKNDEKCYTLNRSTCKQDY